jgi:hypothetical protein
VLPSRRNARKFDLLRGRNLHAVGARLACGRFNG